MIEFLLLDDEQYFLLLGEEEILIHGYAPAYREVERAARKGRKTKRSITAEADVEKIRKSLVALEKRSVRLPHVRSVLSLINDIVGEPKRSQSAPSQKVAKPRHVDDSVPIDVIRDALKRISMEIRNATIIIVLADE